MYKICRISIWRIFQLILSRNLSPYGDGQFQELVFKFTILLESRNLQLTKIYSVSQKKTCLIWGSVVFSDIVECLAHCTHYTSIDWCTTEGHYFSMLIKANSQYLFCYRLSRNKCNKFVSSSMTQQHRIHIDLPNTAVGPKNRHKPVVSCGLHCVRQAHVSRDAMFPGNMTLH